MNDRVNLTISRQLPKQTVADVTLFMNFGHYLGYARNVNIADERIKAGRNLAQSREFFVYGTKRVLTFADVFGRRLKELVRTSI